MEFKGMIKDYTYQLNDHIFVMIGVETDVITCHCDVKYGI